MPIRNQAHTFFLSLFDTTGTWVADPPLVAGDVQVSKAGGAWANIATLPVVSPAGSEQVLVTLSAAETDVTGEVAIRFVDQAGAIWHPITARIDFAPEEVCGLTPAENTALLAVAGQITAAHTTTVSTLVTALAAIQVHGDNTWDTLAASAINGPVGIAVDAARDAVIARGDAAWITYAGAVGGGGDVNVTAINGLPVAQTLGLQVIDFSANKGGRLTLVQGDSYMASESRAVSWSSSEWMDLTTATCKLTIYSLQGSTIYLDHINGIFTQAGAVWTADVDITGAQTGAIPVNTNYQYDLEAHFPNGNIVTLIRGACTIEDPLS